MHVNSQSPQLDAARGNAPVDGFPESIRDEAALEQQLTSPSPALIECIRTVSSPLVVLGAGGKMGPTLAVLAKRAATMARRPLEVIAVSRFSDSASQPWLEAREVKTLQADLLERKDFERLPDTTNVIYLVGLKFGTAQAPELTWASNILVPAHTMERYAGARIVALSTGNVYPMVPVSSGGAREDSPLTPLGEYANSAVARERVFSYFSNKQGTRVALIRLNYAVELRYGVLVDIAKKVAAGEPVDLSNGFLNCIWQRDANEMILRALALAASPATPWNLTSPETLRVRELAEVFGHQLGKTPVFAGQERDTALLSNAGKLCSALGRPATPLERVLAWTADWARCGGRLLNKPTHFEVRDGKY
jgi:nucleoside-diphosphate-sugar epimerase